MATQTRELRGASQPGREELSGARRGAWAFTWSLPVRVAVALGLVAGATLGRLALGLIGPDIVPFGLYFPAILLSALVGGWRIGAVATVVSGALAWALFLRPASGLPYGTSTDLINLALYGAAAAAIVAVAGYVRRLLDRLDESRAALAERTLHHEALFRSMSEGFALCEAIRDETGRLTDYVIAEMNPALQRMLGVGPEVVGGKLSRTPGEYSRWLALCDHVLRTGESRVFESHNRRTDLWHEIHIDRVTPTLMSQLFFDVTERKRAEMRLTELFDELNHRVKNNLAIVASTLTLQARGADAATRAELGKAVDRVQSIAAVHESLYNGHHTGDVDFGAYLESLCGRLARSLLGEDERIEIVVEAASAPMAADRVVALGMVVNELVTNAVKHAYPPPQRGVITVRFRPGEKMTDSGAMLSVGDTGQGLPEDFEKKPGGLGVRLLRSLVRQAGGRLTVRRRPGATFEIRLPAQAAEPAAAE